MRLCRQCHDTAVIFNGYTIGQVSLEYALALLETGGDAARADAIIDRTLDFQNRDADSPTRGNFRWMAHFTEVRDGNAVAFMTPNYGMLWLRHGNRLSESTRRRMEEMFPLAAIGIDKHVVPWQCTNISLLRIWSWMVLGRITNDNALVQKSSDHWDEWLRGTSQGGVCEYNSPCYTPVALYTLAGMWEECEDSAWKASIERVLEFLYTEFAANLHARSACMTGTMSRGYPSDYLYGTGLSAITAYQQFGVYHSGEWDSNGGRTPFIANFAVHNYEVPAALRDIPQQATSPYLVRAAIPAAKTLTSNFISDQFALGSLSSLELHPQAIPVIAYQSTNAKRRTLFLKAAPARGAEVLCEQRENEVIGYLRLAAPAEVTATTAAEVRRATWWLGAWRDIVRIRVDGSPWNGGSSEFVGSVALWLEVAGLRVDLQVTTEPENRLELAVCYKELQLQIDLAVAAESDQLIRVVRPEMAFLLRVSAASQSSDAPSLHIEREWGRITRLWTQGENSLSLKLEGARAAMEDEDSGAYDLLHTSPLLQLRRGDLG